MIIIFNIIGWSINLLCIWQAVFVSNGIVILNYNYYGEMMFEFYMIITILFFGIISAFIFFIYILKTY